MEKTEKTPKQKMSKARKAANIVVITVASLALLIIITIAVLCGVKVKPTRSLEAPLRYEFYTLESKERQPSNAATQSRLSAAMNGMDFNVMSAILQGSWDYSYNFKRDSSKNKITLTADEVKDISATATEFMVEWIYEPVKIVDGNIDYSTAHTLKVDGETVYFDRIKMLISNTNGKVGTISIYPYIDARIGRTETDNDDLSSYGYTITGINIRANTTTTFSELKKLAEELEAENG